MPHTARASDPHDRSLPSEYVGKLAPNWYCRAWNAKRRKYCRSRAGQKTEHVGSGRCAIHGGNAAVQHGQNRRYELTTLRVQELIDDHLAAPNPLDLLPDLAAARALLQDYIERVAEDEHPGGLPEAIKLIAKIATIVEGIERIKAQGAINLADLSRLLNNMGLIVRKHVSDADICDQIQQEWDALRL